MGRKSSISQLAPEIREAVDRAIREGRASAEQIVEIVNGMGAQVSASAVTRYARTAREQMETYRRAQEIASVWAKRIEEQPGGDVAQLNIQLLSTLAFKVLSDINNREAEDPVNPMEMMLLAKALDHASKAERTNLERDLRIRKEVTQKAADAATQVAKRTGLSAETAADIRREILGVAA
ncbi:MAG: DUF3486 family protein [Gammaproteobacteria bacterium]|nr:DUF3486 family protein [Gammaproteobacteria bacterium]